MKAIKCLIFLFFVSSILLSCNTKEQAKQSLTQSTKDYFEVKDGSKFTFANVADSNVTIEYTSSGFFNNQSNPDMENSEVMGYSLNAPGQDMLTIRCETGGAQYNDRIAMITKKNDINYAEPVMFNMNGDFSAVENSLDSVLQYPSYTINGKVFSDVIRIVTRQPIIYSEVYYAKNIGLIAKKEKNGTFLYVKKYTVIK